MAKSQVRSPGTNTLAIISLISGILGWLFFILTVLASFLLGILTLATLGIGLLFYCCVVPLACLSPIGWLVGVITGHSALGQLRENSESGEGMAKAGLIMGYVGLGLFIISICVIIALVATGSLSLMSLPFIMDSSYY